jgi:hypothetical protein
VFSNASHYCCAAERYVIHLSPVVKKNDFVESSGLGVVADGKLAVGIG